MLVGYKLIQISDGTIVNEWGGTWGQCPGVPNPLVLPNGDHVCGAVVDEDYGGYRLIQWEMDPPPPSTEDVIRERERRLAVGFFYNFGTQLLPDVQHVGTTEQDMAGWDEVTTWANAQIALGDTTATVQILTDNGQATVTALQWMGVINAASAFRQPIWQASFALQAMSPIPADYTNDKWW